MCNSQGLEGHTREWLKQLNGGSFYNGGAGSIIGKQQEMGEHTGLISLESHYHHERHGGGDREPEPSKISSFLEGTTIKNHDFGEKNTITANHVIRKGGNQRNKYPGPSPLLFPSFLPCLPLAEPNWKTEVKGAWLTQSIRFSLPGHRAGWVGGPGRTNRIT